MLGKDSLLRSTEYGSALFMVRDIDHDVVISYNLISVVLDGVMASGMVFGLGALTSP